MTCRRSEGCTGDHTHMGLPRPSRARDFKDNPPWLAQAIAQNLDLMQKQVNAAFLPTISDSIAKGDKVLVDFKEYGCGAYGCVMPTHDERVVLKITTDASEHKFVEEGMRWGWPAGITTYYALMDFTGWYRLPKSMRREPAWALWRESARLVGELDVLEPLAELGEDATAFEQRADAFQLFDLLYASGARLYAITALEDPDLQDWRQALEMRHKFAEMFRQTPVRKWSERLESFKDGDSVVKDLGVHMEAYVQVMAKMTADPICSAIGLALQFYLERNLALADLHTGNFGIVERERPTWAITDPGHMIRLPVVWR